MMKEDRNDNEHDDDDDDEERKRRWWTGAVGVVVVVVVVVVVGCGLHTNLASVMPRAVAFTKNIAQVMLLVVAFTQISRPSCHGLWPSPKSSVSHATGCGLHNYHLLYR